MIASQVARIIANVVVQLSLTDEEDLHPDTAVSMLESLAADVDELDKPFLRQVVDAFPIIAQDYEGEARQLVLDIPAGFFLEDTLAEDDPVGSTELTGLHDEQE
ncbi:hypothetical protein D9601_03360 [Sphingomonas sp. MA1305]|uniref:hypothetical protein n=1 Tax=Sphingomonas sp. MA1305 TaxID=2479204 RepID=UPI0018DF8C78|nr:hypothetical protein [Sphingomonas sp. MA1305]MBI0474402.1 hypothetical protein [Sphingomonas sp. MA1305]